MAVEKAIDLTISQRKLVVNLLHRFLPNTEAWAFGSRVQWTSNPHSDLDLVVFANTEQHNQVDLLREAFEESDLPFRVDLLVWDRLSVDFKDVVRESYFILTLEKKSQITDCSKDNWQLMALGELLQLRYGRGLPKKSRNQKGIIPVYGSNGVIGFHDQAYTENGAVIIGRKGTAGAVHYSERPCWPIDTTYYIPQTKCTDLLRFQYYLLSSLNLENLNSHSAVPGLNRDNVHAQIVSVPPEGEQKRIAKVLGALDDKIELNHRMNQILEEIARALFKSWFVDFDPVRAKMAGKDPGLPKEIADLFPDRLVDSELGEIPEGWHTCRLVDEFTIIMGQSPPGSTYNENAEGVPFYQGRKDFTFRFPNRRVYCSAPTRYAKPLDTLVSVRAPVGDTNLAFEDCAIGRGIAAVRNKNGASSYAYYHINCLAAKLKAFEAQGTVFGSINKNDFGAIRCLHPPNNIIQKFESIAHALDNHIKLNERKSRNLVTVKDELLPRLMSGQLNI